MVSILPSEQRPASDRAISIFCSSNNFEMVGFWTFPDFSVFFTASIFLNDFTATERGQARILAHHTALAPSVDVVVSRDYESPRAPGVTVPGFTNPTADVEAALSQINAEFRPGEWDVALEVDGATVFGPDTIELKPFTATYIYAVGDFFGGTFQYLVYTEEGLRSNRGGSEERETSFDRRDRSPRFRGR